MIFSDPDTMIAKAENYFGTTEKPTISGLCLYLGFESRQSFYDYQNRPAFSYAVKRLRLRIENEYETGLRSHHTTGCIFALKQFGWKDTQEITSEVTTKKKDLTEEEIAEELKKRNIPVVDLDV